MFTEVDSYLMEVSKFQTQFILGAVLTLLLAQLYPGVGQRAKDVSLKEESVEVPNVLRSDKSIELNVLFSQVLLKWRRRNDILLFDAIYQVTIPNN